MTDWTLKLPIRDPNEVVSVRTVAELPDHLIGDDADTCREVLMFFHQIGLRAGKSISIGLIERLFEGFNPDERRAMLDVARLRAGLPSRKAIEDRVRFEAAQTEARIRMAESSPYRICSERSCNAIPTNGAGLPIPVDVVRWWCSEHVHLAAEGDMQPRPSPLRYGPSGAFIEVDEAEELRAAAKARSRQAQREAEHADRLVEARERAELDGNCLRIGGRPPT